ncbi:MAG TPA: hypothetical protein VH083_24780 [Myxococcales bacterium]|jgi:hypothetical protein|nr:hypothetical protein [Myxococcales bacterium]
MRILASAIAGLCLALAFTGCGTDPRSPAAPVTEDAGLNPDAGDAGEPSDAGQSPDAGAPVDAGETPDAGEIPDAGPADAGDAGPADAGDAGTVDAGAPDAGDAGVVVLFDDAGCPLPTNAVLDPADAGIPADGLTLWLRTDIGLAATDAGVICRWEDVSGNGNHFLPGTVTPALYDATGLSGHPAVSIQGPNQYLIRSGVLGIPAASARTVALIGQTQDTTHRYQSFEQGQAGTAGTYFGIDMNTFHTSGAKEGVYVTNNAFDSNIDAGTDIRTHVYSISSFASGGVLPGVLIYSVNGVVSTLSFTPDDGLGNGTVEDFSKANFTTVATGQDGFTGAKLGDVVVYSRALNDDERAAVEAYLRARFPPP